MFLLQPGLGNIIVAVWWAMGTVLDRRGGGAW